MEYSLSDGRVMRSHAERENEGRMRMGDLLMWRWWRKSAPSHQPRSTPPPSITQCDSFLGLLLASGLVSFSDLREACASFDTSRNDEAALEELCNHLIALQLVTDWQCSKLRSGKWKGFYLDDYRLLAQSEPSDSSNRKYVAEDVSTGTQVILQVRRLNAAPWIDYSVVLE
jgi:hypothetical protein